MCLWLVTACLGLLPANPPSQNIIVIQAVPTPILQPTTTTTTTVRPGNMSSPGSPPPMSTAPNPPSTAASSARPPSTMQPTSPATTNPPPPPATTNMPTTGGVNSVRVCDNPLIVCVVNPDQPVTGPPMIDPRLGTTPPASAALQVPIMGYNGQVSADTSVRFPRDKRGVRQNRTRRHHVIKRQICSCVQIGSCYSNYGAGLIDFRIVTPGGNQCPNGQEYCCGGHSQSVLACGTRQPVASTYIIASGQADYGEYPWMAILLTNQNDYVAGGVLIDQFNVLTVIHRLSSYIVAGTTPNVKVRLGEWDAAATYEPYPFQEYSIRRVFTHPSFNAATLQYDVAVVRLASPVPLSPMPGSAPTINRACLPSNPSSTYTGQRCWVSGWGRNAFGSQGQFQQILKEVDVPVVDPNTCQTQLRNARLGANYVLDTTSFICAGGEANKDSCTGDGGSGLVCQVNGQWVLVGLVSWGLGCAMANVPGVYTNVAALSPWIQQQIATT